jgi:hypothetical protein
MTEAVQIANSRSGSATLAVAHSIEKHQVAAVVMVLAILPVVLPYPALAINILIFGLFATGFNLLFGYTGLLSLGHAALTDAGLQSQNSDWICSPRCFVESHLRFWQVR